MNSLCLNFYIVHYLLDKQLLPSDWAFAVYLATATWVAWIGLARVYMGLHTPIDIGAGALLGTLVLVFYLALDGSQQYAHLSYCSCSRLFAMLILKLPLFLHGSPIMYMYL